MRKSLLFVLGLAAFSVTASGEAPQSELWLLSDGHVTIYLDDHELGHLGMRVEGLNHSDDRALTLAIDDTSDVVAAVGVNDVEAVYSDHIGLTDALRVTTATGEILVVGLLLDEPSLGLHADTERAVATVGDDAVLILRDLRAGVNRTAGRMSLPSMSVVVSDGLARALGDASLAGKSIGRGVIGGTATTPNREGLRFDYDGKTSESRALRPADKTASGVVQRAGPDMTFCQLYDLRQFGRSGTTLGLAIATTSWNVGSADLKWFQNPDEEHPFIVSNLYRLEDDQFEHIGQSWIKHGFFALDSEQCGTPCTYEPGHGQGDWLGMGCTDTYTSSLNASQSGLGPRYEVNPWTGRYRYPGSHLAGNHGHDGQIDHRLQVNEADLSPTIHPSARYFVEGYYIVGDDVEHMNNGAWKEVLPVDPPGSTWTFDMSGPSTLPNEGFAIDGWTDARQTVIAQEVPVRTFDSPDGRCILAAKATDLGGDIWRYEYALLNIDMDRKVNSFSVPVFESADVQNIGFHHAPSHGEPFTNLPWTAEVANGAVTWTTDENPLRWGTLYNFRFDVNAAPVDTTVTLGQYEPGAPATLTGITTGPLTAQPQCQPSSPPTAELNGLAKNRFLSVHPGNPGEETAIRVTLDSLLHMPALGQVAGHQPDFSAFEGEVRWVGPPSVYSEHSAGGDTFVAAELRCDPYFRDWGTIDLLHVYGPAIVPHSSYSVQQIHTSCLASLDVEQAYSEVLPVASAFFGDVVAPFAGDPGIAQPVDFRDIASLVEKFTGSLEPLQVRAQVSPNLVDVAQPVDFRDIAIIVEAFVSGLYELEGPVGCPES